MAIATGTSAADPPGTARPRDVALTVIGLRGGMSLGLAINHTRPVVEPSADLVQPTAGPAPAGKDETETSGQFDQPEHRKGKTSRLKRRKNDRVQPVVKHHYDGDDWPEKQDHLSNSSNSRKLRNGRSIGWEQSPIAG